MADIVPVCTDLADVYGEEELGAARKRYQILADAFQERYGAGPQIFARSPGRVNLIGEHIDYEGFAVLPMAITKDTVVAIRVTDQEELVISNINGEKYPVNKFGADPNQAVNVAEHSWGNYFLAAYKGVHEYLNSKKDGVPIRGLQVLVDGCVPTGSGLSSSSAFVCAASLALLGVYGKTAPKQDVAEFTCTCERHVGTESGGMDQAISIMAKRGVAKLVEFNPVRGTDVELPPGATFVIANSLTVSNKAETADSRYNLRVVECQLASMTLAKKLGAENPLTLTTLDQIKSLLETQGSKKTPCAAVSQSLHEGFYSVQEVEEILGSNLDELFSESASALRVLKKAKEGTGFKLLDRSLHVFQEATRVHEFRSVCESDVEAGAKLTKLGNLMNASHSSCRDLYECSCPELEGLIGVANEAGSLGSRLTGAGWGGCSVFLVKDRDVVPFIEHLKVNFFAKRVESGLISNDSLDDCVFSSKPSSGGAILKLVF
ncbi:hypothetical protein BSKO_07070 [Bryopsis sp. KO-2023]|nr:hypothetical protein BSKO_07070 [Bryopsis sp. KO-2023]